MSTLIPKEITVDKDVESPSLHIASFSYYDGIKYAKDNNLKQTTNFDEVLNGTHFVVCCGDVMVKVKETDYPNIERRII